MSKAGFSVTVLGTASAMPLHGRHHSAQWVQADNQVFLIDCGEATQYQLLRYGLPYHRLQAIFISHLHADHVGGLSGLLTTLHLQGHVKPLYVYGPLGLRAFIQASLMGTYQVLRYPLHIVEVWPDQEKVCLWTSPSVVVWAFALKHGIPALGFRFQEQERPARLDATKAAHLNLSPAEIACLRAQGFIAREGQTYTWAALSLPSAAPRSYVYCSDTCFEPALVSFVKGANMLYHEATFLSAQAERARQTYHATAAQAATLAKLAQAKQLLIGHFSARYKDLTPFLQEAQVIFPATTLAQEGHTYTIPEHA